MNIKNFVLSLSVLALSGVAAFGQTALTTTTLSAAVPDTKAKVVYLSATTGVTVPGAATGSTLGGPVAPYNLTVIVVDREVMRVNAFGAASGSVLVERGAFGTRATPHYSGALAYVTRPANMTSVDLYGPCTINGLLVVPQINPNTGGVFNCANTAAGGMWANYNPYYAGTAPTVGATIASASTIAPTANVTHISGTVALSTITVPAGMPNGGQITLIFDGADTWTAGSSAGQIKVASAAAQTAGETLTLTFDSSTGLWYPSHL